MVLDAASRSFGFELETTSFPWSCETYLSEGRMMPEDGIDTLKAFDAILLGAVGWPQRVPDSVSLHGLLLPIRKSFDLYANIRPHRLLPGVVGPLRAEAFDILCIRENTEGEYSGAGGRIHIGTPDEVAVETSVFTRRGVERILRFGFEQAKARRGKLASVTKSNAQKHSMVFWDEVTEALAPEYPDVEVSRYHIDAIAARFVMQPESLDVVVASNLFGDILTDLGAAIQGGLGFAPSPTSIPAPTCRRCSSLCTDRPRTSLEGGSPIPSPRSGPGAMMLERLGRGEAAAAILDALGRVTTNPSLRSPTRVEAPRQRRSREASPTFFNKRPSGAPKETKHVHHRYAPEGGAVRARPSLRRFRDARH